ncbi:MAG: hypothetical protein H7Y13_03380 [Sphingobacteriaceae bacterium]|nr:hypothetical protein [Sphingobacteriaceae bacterium]
MKTHNIFRKVGSILAEINEQYQYLSESPEKLNDLELELLAANADFLAEHIKVLRKLNPSQTEPTPIAEILPQDLSQSDQYRESVSGIESMENADHLIKQELPESYSSFHIPTENSIPVTEAPTEETEAVPFVPEFESTTQWVEETTPEIIEPIKEASFDRAFTPEANPLTISSSDQADPPKVIEEVSEQIIPSVISEEPAKVLTVNDLMSAQRAQASAFAKPQPVSDLKSIINLNDKLLFIKDLFNGYSLAYSEAIEIINRFDSFSAADNFLKANYSVKNNWASRQDTADKFYELLNRRFAK